MKEFKIKLKGTEHSEMVQEKLFALGYEWCSSGTKIMGYDYETIACVHNGDMERSEGVIARVDEFLTLDDLYDMEKKPKTVVKNMSMVFFKPKDMDRPMVSRKLYCDLDMDSIKLCSEFVQVTHEN